MTPETCTFLVPFLEAFGIKCLQLNLSFILATMRGGVDIMRSGDYCSPHMIDEITGESDDSGNILTLGAEFNYCAINKFNFAARTAGI